MIIFGSKTKTKLQYSQFLVQKLKLNQKLLNFFSRVGRTGTKLKGFIYKTINYLAQFFEHADVCS